MAKGLGAKVSLKAFLVLSLMVLVGISVHSLGSDPVPILGDKESVWDSSDDGLFRPAFGDEFDLGACQQECRSKYGVDPYWGHGGGTSMWRLYAICIQDCNSKFWKEYDRRIQKLKNLELD